MKHLNFYEDLVKQREQGISQVVGVMESLEKRMTSRLNKLRSAFSRLLTIWFRRLQGGPTHLEFLLQNHVAADNLECRHLK